MILRAQIPIVVIESPDERRVLSLAGRRSHGSDRLPSPGDDQQISHNRFAHPVGGGEALHVGLEVGKHGSKGIAFGLVAVEDENERPVLPQTCQPSPGTGRYQIQRVPS